MDEMLEATATLVVPEFDELAELEEERVALIAEELREAIRRKVTFSD
jgi:hypothetical protein